MRIAIVLVCGWLAGCSASKGAGAPGEDFDAGTPPEDASTADESSLPAEAGAGDDAQPYADVLVEAGDDGAALALCRQTACSNVGAECGLVAATCGGVQVDCGACTNKWCGDNGRANKCGVQCLAQNWEVWCGQAGLPDVHAFQYGCTQGPYWIASGVQTFRSNGLMGCVYHQVDPTLYLWCCP